jgi:hypothetical protein
VLRVWWSDREKEGSERTTSREGQAGDCRDKSTQSLRSDDERNPTLIRFSFRTPQKSVRHLLLDSLHLAADPEDEDEAHKAERRIRVQRRKKGRRDMAR